MKAAELELKVNGVAHRVEVEPSRSLLSVLRDELDLTGSKYGCGEGRCAACTVLIDGEPSHSCLTRVGTVAGKEIRTIEGLENEGELHPLQQAFLEVEAFQCGFCTPGMLMAGVALLERNAEPTEEEVIDAMDGHICRCGTYKRIVAAIQLAAGQKGGRA